MKKNFSLTEILNKIFFKIINVFKNYFYGIFYSKEITLKQRKVLILSHLINKNNLKIKNDFYFGEIGKILKRKNISYQFILLNHTNEFSYKLNEEK